MDRIINGIRAYNARKAAERKASEYKPTGAFRNTIGSTGRIRIPREERVGLNRSLSRALAFAGVGKMEQERESIRHLKARLQGLGLDADG